MTGAAENGVTHFVVEIVDGSEPVRGRVALHTGEGAEFNGWTEFAATLERFLPAQDQSAQGAGSGADADEWMSSAGTRDETRSTTGPSRKITSRVPGPMAAPSNQPVSAPPP